MDIKRGKTSGTRCIRALAFVTSLLCVHLLSASAQSLGALGATNISPRTPVPQQNLAVPGAPPPFGAPPAFGGPPPFDGAPFDGPPRFRGPPGFGPGGRGPGGFGGVQQERKLLTQFDKDGDGRLNSGERTTARESLAKEGSRRGPGRGPWGRNQDQTPPEPGPKVSPTEVTSYADTPLFDEKVLRTIFIQFDNADWEKELSDFYHSDVEVAAKVTVDRKTYSDVGVGFRGASSYMMVAEGRKRSLRLSMDFVKDKQRLEGNRTLHLLNSHGDPTFVRSVLFNHIAREYIPAPRANFVRVVINGESWGVFINQQSFNKDFLQDWFGTSKGARWKAPGSPQGNSGLAYLGDEIAPYKRLYEIKSKDDTNSWMALVQLCRVLNKTPAEELEKALTPLLDIDGVLKYLAIDSVFINNDGYWVRASDYNLYLDDKGKFHVLPHDSNETFRSAEGPGMRRSEGGRGIELEPFAGSSDTNKPLLSKLLAVPSLRTRYLGYVREVAEKWLSWEKVGPLVEQYQQLISADVKTDARKLDSFEAFQMGGIQEVQDSGFPGRGRTISLKSFVEQRRAYLLKYLDQTSGSTTAIKVSTPGN